MILVVADTGPIHYPGLICWREMPSVGNIAPLKIAIEGREACGPGPLISYIVIDRVTKQPSWAPLRDA